MGEARDKKLLDLSQRLALCEAEPGLALGALMGAGDQTQLLHGDFQGRASPWKRWVQWVLIATSVTDVTLSLIFFVVKRERITGRDSLKEPLSWFQNEFSLWPGAQFLCGLPFKWLTSCLCSSQCRNLQFTLFIRHHCLSFLSFLFFKEISVYKQVQVVLDPALDFHVGAVGIGSQTALNRFL